MNYFDSHCHLQFPQYEKDLPEVLARMQGEEIGAVVVGTDPETSRAGVALAEKYDFLWASVGLHPNDSEVERLDTSRYEALARHPKVVAIGECGLDYFRSSGAGQKERFLQQVELAKRLNKALIIHCREAHHDLLAILEEQKLSIPVIMHFFTASADIAQKYVDLGCYLSFPGPITFTDMYDESVRMAPLDRLLVETDAPFAAPAPYRGKRNEPSYVVEVVKKIATLKGMPEGEVGAQAVKNAKKAFGLL